MPLASAEQPGFGKICIALRQPPGVSETFIRNHIAHLADEKEVVYGEPVCYAANGQPLMHHLGFFRRGFKSGCRRLLGWPDWRKSLPRATANYLKKIKAAAVLAEYGMSGVDTMAACRLTGIPLIVHFHGHDAYRKTVLEEYGRRYLEMFQTASAIIAVSQHMQKQLINLGASTENVHLIPYGVDTNYFSGSQPERAAPKFIAVGRFVEKKAPHLTLLAFHQVWRACPEVRLTMMGEGPLLPLCRQLTRALGLGSAVDFPGAASSAEVAAAMRQSRAFVQHSVVAEDGDSEGTPVAVIEAQASGLPVIATKHAGIPDVVVEGETGFLVDEQDVAGMAERMVRLARNRDLARDMGLNGRQRMVAHFQLEDQLNKLTRILERSIGIQPSSPQPRPELKDFRPRE
jgi:glycosyltransferase involved in cell wall biosynthesis